MHDLLEKWNRRWPGCRPLGYELRATAKATWVRFHSLPESKRYPESEDEFAELLGRHHSVIAELLAGRRAILVFTYAWTDRSIPEEPRPDTTHWTTFRDDATWVHVYAQRVEWHRGAIDPMLREVAVGSERIMVSAIDLAWLYWPYDGGGDVIAASVADRDRLRAAHRDWLSKRRDGL